MSSTTALSNFITTASTLTQKAGPLQQLFEAAAASSLRTPPAVKGDGVKDATVTANAFQAGTITLPPGTNPYLAPVINSINNLKTSDEMKQRLVGFAIMAYGEDQITGLDVEHPTKAIEAMDKNFTLIREIKNKTPDLIAEDAPASLEDLRNLFTGDLNKTLEALSKIGDLASLHTHIGEIRALAEQHPEIAHMLVHLNERYRLTDVTESPFVEAEKALKGDAEGRVETAVRDYLTTFAGHIDAYLTSKTD